MSWRKIAAARKLNYIADNTPIWTNIFHAYNYFCRHYYKNKTRRYLKSLLLIIEKTLLLFLVDKCNGDAVDNYFSTVLWSKKTIPSRNRSTYSLMFPFHLVTLTTKLPLMSKPFRYKTVYSFSETSTNASNVCGNNTVTNFWKTFRVHID